jgi:hypothetical protein
MSTLAPISLCLPTRHPRQYVLLYIFWALLYELKNRGFFSMLDEELWVYMDFKAYDPYSLISFLN